MKVNLRLIAENINLPTVIRTAVLPGESSEKLFIATQIGEIFYVVNNNLKLFLDIKSKIIKLGSQGGYDERGLLGLAFHPQFNYNGLFYIHYTVAGSQGKGALNEPFKPNPCDTRTLNLKWTNRDTKYDHIDTVEEWILQKNGKLQKRKTLLNLRRPFLNHNGYNSLNFSPETGKLVLTTGDGGDGYDPFNLSQDDMEIAGKIIEIDLENYPDKNINIIVSRFDELPDEINNTLIVIAKGVRNISGITYQKFNNTYIKSIGNVGQDQVESIFSFINYVPVPVIQLVKNKLLKEKLKKERFINFGWRSWEGIIPTSVIRSCSMNSNLSDKVIAYYDESIKTSSKRLSPLIDYYHNETNPEKFNGTAITGVKSYMGNEIPELTNNIVFVDLAKKEKSDQPIRGVLAHTKINTNGKPIDYDIINIDYNLGPKPSYFMCLGTNLNQSKLYLGVYESMKVTDLNKGKVFEIISS